MKWLKHSGNVLMLWGCCLLGCSPVATTASAVYPGSVAINASLLEAVAPDSLVKVTLVTKDPSTSTHVTGTVVKSDASGMELKDCTIQYSHMTKTPVLSDLPYVSRYFKNTGVGVEKGVALRTYAQSEIAQVEELAATVSGSLE